MFVEPMSSAEFNAALRELKTSVYHAAKVLGISLRQAQRYSSGEQTVSYPTAGHLRMLLLHIREDKAQRRKLLKQLKDLETGRFHVREGGRDVTKEWANRTREMVQDLEKLLAEHPSGLRPGIS